MSDLGHNSARLHENTIELRDFRRVMEVHMGVMEQNTAAVEENTAAVKENSGFLKKIVPYLPVFEKELVLLRTNTGKTNVHLCDLLGKRQEGIGLPFNVTAKTPTKEFGE